MTSLASAATTTTTTTTTATTPISQWSQEAKDEFHATSLATYQAQVAQDKINARHKTVLAKEQALLHTKLQPVSRPPLPTTTTTTSRAGQDGFEISVAPMMKWTTRHYRFMARLLTKRTLLYTEMICTSTILNRQDDLDLFLGYDEVEHPLAIQLGGADPEEMRQSAVIAEQWGYDEIDINVGCPSDKVAGQGCFGASLMLDHGKRVAEVVKAVLPAVTVPVTIKCRLGADDVDKYEDLIEFVETLSAVGVTHFIVHARKCLLNGLSPTQNRTIPPLRYDWVHQVAREYPHLEFSINGGFTTMEMILEQRKTQRTVVGGGRRRTKKVNATDRAQDPAVVEEEETKGQGGGTGGNGNGGHGGNGESSKETKTVGAQSTGVVTPLGVVEEKPLLRGVMVGRAAYQKPWLLSTVDQEIYGEENQNFTRREIMHRYIVYGEAFMADDVLMRTHFYTNKTRAAQHRKSTVRALLKPVFWMFKGVQNGSRFRNSIEQSCNIKPMPDFRSIVEEGLSIMTPAVLDSRPNDVGLVRGVHLPGWSSGGSKEPVAAVEEKKF